MINLKIFALKNSSKIFLLSNHIQTFHPWRNICNGFAAQK